ncbi:cytidine deaminase [candidate division WOR-3 bacterium]|mgnify:CR=1 FL=1|uniref:Cytidine deaminase n=1 Tax=candidate division WOR-3 bacterium TaxID=2052148 RepID=A0A660SJ83_UNCW3|nr:MAG: cytidine deaminase [candidate division WOR-3 bacterium]
MRPSWHEYFMEIAKLVAQRSTCLRRKVGAVLVKEKRILATGYNGAPRGIRHCAEVGCLRENIPPGSRHEICRGIHAEQNAIIQAAYFGFSIRGSTLYSTHQPCFICTKMLINAGIVEIYYLEEYPDPLALAMLKEAGVGCYHLPLTAEQPGVE